jgi:hypothetical protein
MTFTPSWIAGLASRMFCAPPARECEAGVLVPVETILDEVGEHPDVGLRRRWKEDCRSYRLRLQIFCQEEIIRRERYEEFLNVLLRTEGS